MKKYCICISAYIIDNRHMETLIQCIQSIFEYCQDSFDIFVLNDSHDKKNDILNELKNNNFHNVSVINTLSKGTAYIYIFHHVQTLKDEYQYYINLHDSTHLISPLPELTKDYYYIWSLGKGWKLNEKYLTYSNSIGKRIDLNFDCDTMRKSSQTEFGLYWYMFGCLFIMKRKYIDLIYNTNFKKIYNLELSRMDRIGLEIYLGYLCNTLFLDPHVLSSIEPSPWCDYVQKEQNAFIFHYFKKLSFSR